MTDLETNVFPILNLAELSTQYHLYKIRGLRGNQPEYYQNRQILIRKLSYSLKSPVTVIDLDGQPHLVLGADAPKPHSPYLLVRKAVYFEPVGEPLHLNYLLRNPTNDEICLQFIRFMLQAPLFANSLLWQPGSGKPFFEKAPKQELDSLILYKGFTVRPVITSTGGIGLCVDVQHKFVGRDPLPTHFNLSDFQSYKGRRCIYRYGHQWYEVQLTELSDLNASEQMIPRGTEQVPLLEYVISESKKPIPENLAQLPHDAAVVHYLTNQDEDRTAIAALCHLVYDSEDPIVGRHHRLTILSPHIRRSLIQQAVKSHLRELTFGDVTLHVSETPEHITQAIFQIPDYEFGNGYKLSVRGTEGAAQASLDSIGRKRAELLRNKQVGFYVKEPFDRQYFLLPQSVVDGLGSKFIEDLKDTVDNLYPDGGDYKPIVVSYPDRVPRTFVDQGKAILQAAKEYGLQPGYAVAMLHHTSGRRSRQHDQLAAMVIRELRKEYEIYASVIHSATGQECYQCVIDRQGKPCYRVQEKKRGKLNGYLRAVALNKVLLTNERWPFVLATRLNADVIVGIDVKHHTAGYTIINRHGSEIRTITETSKQKERLLASQIKANLIEILTKEAAASDELLQQIVLHRDGIIYQSEREGAYQAIQELKDEGIIASDAALTILEIAKSSSVYLRLFDVTDRGTNSPFVENPQIGCFHIINGTDGYLCTTGRAFPRPGTVKPLHIRFLKAGMPFSQCLEDIYFLTALAWTRPDDCTRYPITIKLNDRRLGEDASEYDMDALRFDSEGGRKVTDEDEVIDELDLDTSEDRTEREVEVTV